VFDEDTPPDLTPFVAAVATPTSCTKVVVGGQPGGVFTLFDAWKNLPNNPANAGRLSVARGQDVFNKTGCVGCHTVPNLGNNAAAGAGGFRRIGTDSLTTLEQTKDKAPMGSVEAKRMQDMIDRVNQLPLYRLRPNDTTKPDVVTTDPGRALVTGLIADAGLFKPPILRDLGVRSPYFHAGAAPSIEHLITFYNLRFNFGLTPAEQADLANFLEAL
jgi:cytochrome c peroxidase